MSIQGAANATRTLNAVPRSALLIRAARLFALAAAIGLVMALGIPMCPFAIITRHPCPGCGLTRATFALAHGHIREALHLHPLCLVISPLVIGLITYNALVYLRDGRVAAAESSKARWVTALGVALAALTVGVWIARFFGAFGGPVPV